MDRRYFCSIGILVPYFTIRWLERIEFDVLIVRDMPIGYTRFIWKGKQTKEAMRPIVMNEYPNTNFDRIIGCDFNGRDAKGIIEKVIKKVPHVTIIEEG